MTDIVNLNRARKTKAKAASDLKAAANRAAFGRTKAQKRADENARARIARTLDRAKRGE